MEIAEFLLTNAGAEIIRASNGKEAVEAFAKSDVGEVNVILMDIMTIMVIAVMTGMIMVTKIIAIISIRIIIVKTLEITIKIPIAQMIITTGRTKNSSGNITSIIIRRIMQIPETVTKTPIEATRITTASHQEAPLM